MALLSQAGERNPSLCSPFLFPAITVWPSLRFVSSGFAASNLRHSRYHPVHVVPCEAHSLKTFQIFYLLSSNTIHLLFNLANHF